MSELVIESDWGTIRIRLLEDRAPKTCQFFEDWVRSVPRTGFSVFRILSPANQEGLVPCPIHVVQMGQAGMARDQCFSSRRFPLRLEDTRITGLTHKQWTVSAARINLHEYIGSFFICMRDEPELDHGGKRNPDGQGFAAFGEVIAGFDTLWSIFAMAGAEEWLQVEIPLVAVTIADGPGL